MSKCQEHVVQRVCVPALCLYMSICAHESLSLHWWACMCRSCVFYATSIRLDVDTRRSARLLMRSRLPCFFFLHFSLRCHLYLWIMALSDCQTGLPVLISSSAVPIFSPSPSFLSSISLMLPLLGVQAQTEREKKLAVRHIRSASTSPPLYPTVHSPLLPFFLPSFLPPSFFPFSCYLSLLRLVASLIH